MLLDSENYTKNILPNSQKSGINFDFHLDFESQHIFYIERSKWEILLAFSLAICLIDQQIGLHFGKIYRSAIDSHKIEILQNVFTLFVSHKTTAMIEPKWTDKQ